MYVILRNHIQCSLNLNIMKRLMEVLIKLIKKIIYFLNSNFILKNIKKLI